MTQFRENKQQTSKQMQGTQVKEVRKASVC